ncbi:phosphoribosyl-AMP cyclohydrolase [Candidatus Microgenomates bacterium]|nr:MAG: phosphoribosyl-AMP cyclohydrolase [Candidatus Microgenomates bacterium]
MKKVALDFQKNNGLIPTVVQDVETGAVLMLGFMNERAFEKTQKSGWVYFWSRSRNKLWMKGELSSNKLKVQEIFSDCDQDTLLIKAIMIGGSVCHTGNQTCFFTKLNTKI